MGQAIVMDQAVVRLNSIVAGVITQNTTIKIRSFGLRFQIGLCCQDVCFATASPESMIWIWFGRISLFAESDRDNGYSPILDNHIGINHRIQIGMK
jgi:hypothetical protein